MSPADPLARARALLEPLAGPPPSTPNDAERALGVLEDGRAALSASAAGDEDLLAKVDAAIACARAFLAAPTDAEPLAASLDALLEALREDPEEAAPPVDPQFLELFLESCRERTAEVEALVLGLEGERATPETAQAIRRAIHTLKGESGVLSLHVAQDLLHRAEDLLDTSDTRFPEEPILRLLDWLREYLDRLARDSRCTPPDATELRAMLTPTAAESSGALRDSSDPVESDPTTSAAQPTWTQGESVLKVRTARVDDLVDLVGELVIAQEMVLQAPEIARLHDAPVARALARARKITRALRDTAMAMRMVPLRPTFQRLRRLARDAARYAGKEIHLRFEGEDTELDRTLADALGEPLVHLIRNAIDHGLEDRATREQRGKDPVGTITVAARHDAGSILIEVSDDGRGLDREAVFRRAVERGLLPPETNPEAVSDNELWSYLFHHGFSTAAAVSELSGRGVGLDVVRKQLEALRGKVELTSTPGKGTCFALRLPLTLAIIEGMVIRVRETRYILPALSIEETLRVEEQATRQVLGQESVLDLRGSLLPIHRLDALLAGGNPTEPPREGILIVLGSGTGRACFLADEVFGQQEVVIKSIGSLAGYTTHAAGAAILGDGSVALILDVESLFRTAEGLTAGGVRTNTPEPR